MFRDLATVSMLKLFWNQKREEREHRSKTIGSPTVCCDASGGPNHHDKQQRVPGV